MKHNETAVEQVLGADDVVSDPPLNLKKEKGTAMQHFARLGCLVQI